MQPTSGYGCNIGASQLLSDADTTRATYPPKSGGSSEFDSESDSESALMGRLVRSRSTTETLLSSRSSTPSLCDGVSTDSDTHSEYDFAKLLSGGRAVSPIEPSESSETEWLDVGAATEFTADECISYEPPGVSPNDEKCSDSSSSSKYEELADSGSGDEFAELLSKSRAPMVSEFSKNSPGMIEWEKIRKQRMSARPKPSEQSSPSSSSLPAVFYEASVSEPSTSFDAGSKKKRTVVNQWASSAKRQKTEIALYRMSEEQKLDAIVEILSQHGSHIERVKQYSGRLRELAELLIGDTKDVKMQSLQLFVEGHAGGPLQPTKQHKKKSTLKFKPMPVEEKIKCVTTILRERLATHPLVKSNKGNLGTLASQLVRFRSRNSQAENNLSLNVDGFLRAEFKTTLTDPPTRRGVS